MSAYPHRRAAAYAVPCSYCRADAGEACRDMRRPDVAFVRFPHPHREMRASEQVPCPECGAAVGAVCTSLLRATRGQAQMPHPERADRFEALLRRAMVTS